MNSNLRRRYLARMIHRRDAENAETAQRMGIELDLRARHLTGRFLARCAAHKIASPRFSRRSPRLRGES